MIPKMYITQKVKKYVFSVILGEKVPLTLWFRMASMDAMAKLGLFPGGVYRCHARGAQSTEQADHGAVILVQTAQPPRSMRPVNIG